MGVRHRRFVVEGVQFHPESVLTPDGPALMGNFLAFGGGRAVRAAMSPTAQLLEQLLERQRSDGRRGRGAR